jgi:hypothetical protein
MSRRLKETYLKFKHDPPGERFKNLYRRWHQEGKGPVGTVLAIVAAVVLMAGGFFLGFIPGLPGFVLGFLGIGILAAQIHPVANWCDRFELVVRRLIGKFRRRVKHS